MSQENVKAFFEKIEGDEDLGDRYRSLLKEMATSNADEGTAMAKVAEFASESGHEFSSNDLKLATENMTDGELNDEELEAVAGGGGVAWVMIGSGSGETESGQVCVVVGYAWGD